MGVGSSFIRLIGKFWVGANFGGTKSCIGKKLGGTVGIEQSYCIGELPQIYGILLTSTSL